LTDFLPPSFSLAAAAVEVDVNVMKSTHFRGKLIGVVVFFVNSSFENFLNLFLKDLIRTPLTLVAQELENFTNHKMGEKLQMQFSFNYATFKKTPSKWEKI
jgi:hypothetical protein